MPSHKTCSRLDVFVQWHPPLDNPHFTVLLFYVKMPAATKELLRSGQLIAKV
jgi:hypothetical protein